MIIQCVSLILFPSFYDTWTSCILRRRSVVKCSFPNQPIVWRTSKRELLWQFGWTHGNFSLAQMVTLSCCVKQVKAPFKMLLAVFLSLDNNRCSTFPFSKILSKIADHMALCLFENKGNFSIRVISDFDYFSRVISDFDYFSHIIVGTLPLNSIWLR